MDSNQSQSSTKRRTESMMNFLSKHSFTSVLSETSDATFHHNNGSQSKIDHIYFRAPVDIYERVKLNKQLCKFEFPDNISSHDVIVGTDCFQECDVAHNVAIPQTDYKNTYTPFITKKPKWDLTKLKPYQEQCSEMLNNILQCHDQPEVLAELFSQALVHSAENNYIKHKPSQAKPKQKPDTPFFSKEYKEAHKYHKETCHQLRLAGRPNDPPSQDSEKRIPKINATNQKI